MWWWAAVAMADPTVVPSGSVFLRGSFDTDGSPYVGRFVPTETKSIDETAAMPTACSQFVTHRFVEGGGVTYSELFEVSDKVALRLGAVIGNAKIGAERHTASRVDYTLTGKLVAQITDPAGFQKCCTEQPGQCTERYVGSVLQGTGKVYREKTSSVTGNADGVHPTTGISAELAVSHGTSWEQAITFDKPVYFAFELTENPYRRVSSAGSCGDWVDLIPVDNGGRFFVGTSKASKSEAQAKSRALRNVQMQVAMANTTSFDPADPAATQKAQNEMMQRVSQLEPREWCIERTTGQKYTARVLGWVPQR